MFIVVIGFKQEEKWTLSTILLIACVVTSYMMP